jgi:hypothetical protein
MDSTTSTESMVIAMQVRDLIKVLSGYSPDDHIAVRFYDNSEFADGEDVSEKSWELVCDDFERDEDIDQMNRDFIDSELWRQLRNEEKA